MRLIDAEKLEEELHSFFGDYSGKIWFEIRDILGEAEEVKAIPIEWMYLWRLKNMDKCPTFYMPFSDLLNDWEKENE